jgi:hypothetical protein
MPDEVGEVDEVGEASDRVAFKQKLIDVIVWIVEGSLVQF